MTGAHVFDGSVLSERDNEFHDRLHVKQLLANSEVHPGDDFGFAKLDEPVASERSLSDSLQHRMVGKLRKQQKTLQEYLEKWSDRQRDVVAQMLSETLAGHQPSYASNQAPNHEKESRGSKQLRMLAMRDALKREEELEATCGCWVDLQGIFNHGQRFRIISEDFNKEKTADSNTQNCTGESWMEQYGASISSQSGLVLTHTSFDGVETCYELMWGCRDTLLVSEPGSKDVCRIHRSDRARRSNLAWSFSSKSWGLNAEDVQKGAEALGLKNHNGSSGNSGLSNVIRRISGALAYSKEIRKTVTQFVHVLPPTRPSLLRRFVTGTSFETVCASVILCNAVFIAVQSDWARNNLDEEYHGTFEKADFVFCLIYTVELCLRIIVWRSYYFCSPDWRWNLFDLFLVALAINEQLSSYIGYSISSHVDGQDMTFLRLLRLLKMLRLLRVVRLMHMFRELRLILNSIMTSMKAMLWSVALIFVVTFMFGMFFLQGVTNYLKQAEDVSAIERQTLDEHWGSVYRSLLSMYMASMAGEDWKWIAQPLEKVGWVFYAAFLAYTGFYACVVTNTFTSLFVEATIAHADTDQRQLIQHELDNKDQYIKMLTEWYDFLTVDNSGAITLEQFEEHLHAPEIVAFAARMEIDVLEVRQFFSVISSHGRRPVDLDTFVVGCIKLKGMAKSMDLMDLIYSHKRAVYEQVQFMKFTEREFHTLKKEIREELVTSMKRINHSVSALTRATLTADLEPL